MSSVPRMTTRQSEAQDRRNRMTNRRQALTIKIRKQKKSEYLARKRNLPMSFVSTPSTSSLESVKELVQSYCRSPSLNTLKILHEGLRATPLDITDDNPLIFFPQKEDPKSAALPFLRLLRQSSNDHSLGLVLDILVNLTALSLPSSGFGGYEYYGHMPLTWSALLAQDSEWLSFLVNSADVHPNSIFVILGNLVGEDSTSVQTSLRQSGVIYLLVDSIRHPVAAWALTNAIRSDRISLGSYYFSDKLLTPQLLGQLLVESAVATQAAWIVASLTSRDEETVHYLIGNSSFFSSLLRCLERPLSNEQLIALVQAFGNIASFESCVAALLSFPSLPQLVGQFMQQTGNRELVTQSAFLAGCLLYGAGMPDHPSTIVAAPILVPILFQQLNDGRSLEENREFACALWNALDLLPDPALSIIPIPIPSQEAIRPSLRTLVMLLKSPDSDAVVAAVNVIDSLLRRINNLQVPLEEEDVREVLEGLCDSDLEEAAEVAADLLDDFFYIPEEPGADSIQSQPPDHSRGIFNLPENPGLGRGRNAIVPSWMSNSQ